MAYYIICPDCGAHLDPGETCDCKDRMEEKLNRSIIHTEEEQPTGQLRMNIRREHEALTIS